jgi:hypothetical protein
MKNDRTIAPSRKFWQIDLNNLSIRDVFVLLPFIIGFLALPMVLEAHFGHENSIKWGGLAVDSSVLFAFLIYRSTEFLKQRFFWLLTASFLVVHLVIWVTLLTHVEHWGLLGFNLMAFEVLPFFYFRDWPR